MTTEAPSATIVYTPSDAENSFINVDIGPVANPSPKTKPQASFWSKISKAATVVEEQLAEWFGLNDSKYQWAVDEAMNRQLAGESQVKPAPSESLSKVQTEPTSQQAMHAITCLSRGSQHLHPQHQHQLVSTASLWDSSRLFATKKCQLGAKHCFVSRPNEGRKESADAQQFFLRASRKSETVVCSELPTFSHAEFEDFLLSMQSTICATAAEADGIGRNFGEDRWQRSEDPSAGYGITRVLEDGDLLEKAAVNVSIVRGQLTESRAKAMSARGRDVGSGAQYFAGALSLVFHSRSPYVPTFRSDVRYFEVEGGGGWFGGGADLTPSYLFEDDARFFHSHYKNICNEFDPTQKLYSESKEACDSYFYIPARKEHRGIGGIFFDDLEKVGLPSSREEENRARVFSFVKAVAEGFMPSFLSIAHLRRIVPYGDRERQWQLIRRGRYLEFNLLYDRGVRFGLEGGRMESIMVSAPPLIAWRYNFTPEADTSEAKLLEVLRKPKAWVDEGTA